MGDLRPEACKLGLRRDLIQIYAEILAKCQNPQPITRIMQTSNTSYDTVKIYVSELLRFNLLRAIENEKKFTTTEKGLLFVAKYFALLDLFSSD